MHSNNENYEQGYKSNLNKHQKIEFRKTYSEKSILKSVFWTFIYLSSIFLTIGLVFEVIQVESPQFLKILVSFFGIVFVVRQMRGLENIVHFASHNNFSKNRRLNDTLSNLLAAWPVMQDVKSYRVFHAQHHGDYGSHTDPCRARLESIGVDSQQISTNYQLLKTILRWMPSYVREYYVEVKSNAQQVLIFVAWHVSIAILLCLFHSWELAAFALTFWIVVMFGILPFVRSIAEFSEHDYQRGDSVAETTFNNLGLLDFFLLHPAGDAWHSLHHLHPTVSWWKQRSAHRYLMKYDSAYKEALHRDHLFQDIANLPAHSSEHNSTIESDPSSSESQIV